MGRSELRLRIQAWLCRLGIHRDCKPQENGIVCQYCGEIIIEPDKDRLLDALY